MMIKNSFNLIDEKWIPVADKGLVSLKDVFSDSLLASLGGTPIQKLAVMKLLLAIAQSAYTPTDDADWKKLGINGMTENVLSYLEKHRESFWLYGERPFLQMPDIIKADKQSYGALLVHVSTGNSTVLTNLQREPLFNDAEKVLLLLEISAFALGGKKTDNRVVLSEGFDGKLNDRGKPRTSKPGPALGFLGFLHNFFLGKSIVETVFMNLLSSNDIHAFKTFAQGLGTPPWEKMPYGEDCEIAKQLKESYMGRLIPLNRFALLADDGIHYSEGILHGNYKEGIWDPSISVNISEKDPKALWVDPGKRPWRQLPSLLSFLSIANKNDKGFLCYHLRACFLRVKSFRQFGIWSGGIRVSNNAGEQYVTGKDDFVESELYFDNKALGEDWYHHFCRQVDQLDNYSNKVYASIKSYYSSLAEDHKFAKKGAELFWELCEKDVQELIEICYENDDDKINTFMKRFIGYVYDVYNTFCPKNTARQIDAWAANKPIIRKGGESGKAKSGTLKRKEIRGLCN